MPPKNQSFKFCHQQISWFKCFHRWISWSIAATKGSADLLNANEKSVDLTISSFRANKLHWRARKYLRPAVNYWTWNATGRRGKYCVRFKMTAAFFSSKCSTPISLNQHKLREKVTLFWTNLNIFILIIPLLFPNFRHLAAKYEIIIPNIEWNNMRVPRKWVNKSVIDPI